LEIIKVFGARMFSCFIILSTATRILFVLNKLFSEEDMVEAVDTEADMEADMAAAMVEDTGITEDKLSSKR